MEKEQIILLKDRGLISISGEDSYEYLQNIITNDIKKVNEQNSIFSALLTPQGKYLCEFFIMKSKNGYFLEFDKEFSKDLIENLGKYKLRSKIEINDLSSKYAVGMLSLEKFKEIQKKEGNQSQTLVFRESSIFIDPRKKILGARIISKLENLYLTIKKLNLKIINEGDYLKKAHINGIPIKGLTYLKDQLFALEANFEELNAIDFKKGCYIGQENTARMKLKNKIRKKLLPIRSNEILEIGTELFFNKVIIGKILITNPYPFALIKMYNPNFSDFKNKEVLAKNKKIEIINTFF